MYPWRHGVHTHSDRIHGLAELLASQDLNEPTPLEAWDPPYRGDIGLAVRADGTWLYQNSPISRGPLVQLFARVLRRDDDGRHYLVTPAERVDVSVEDAPFLAVEMQVEGSGPGQQLIFRTNVDDIVRCGPARPLRFVEEAGNGGLKPYVLVRGRLEALLTRALCYDLVEYAVSAPDQRVGGEAGQPGIWSGGQFFELTI
jgi:hypothetical protein